MKTSHRARHSSRALRLLPVALAIALSGCETGSPPPASPSPTPAAEATRDKPAAPEPTAAAPAAAAAQPLFDGWSKPDLVLVVTGQQLGYIEPCGCTGLENQKGGLARRHTLIKELSDRGWPVVPLDVGSQVRRYGKQSELKFHHSAEALRTMGYRAIALGADDLRLPAGELLGGTNPPDQPSLFVGANLALIDRDLQPQFLVVEAGGKRIGVTAVLGKKYESRLQSDELVHGPAIEALKTVAAQLTAAKCDLYVLLAHAPQEEAREIAKEVPLFDLIVVAGQTNVPSSELEVLPGGKTRLMQTGIKAMYAGVVGVFDEPAAGNALRGDPKFRFESVPLDARLKDSPDMLKLLARNQEELRTLGLEGLGLTPRPHPSGREFVGSDKCGECHTKAFEIWSQTPHAHATDSLVKPPNTRGDIARHFDPECLSCHVTGWDPQQFHPFESGYLGLEPTPLLKHNGCENCHGPGSAHVAAEEGGAKLAPADIATRRGEMKLPLAAGVAERKCLECHDDDNSPDFHDEGAFAKYWKKVEHAGKD